jgi:hypothetical protein
VGSLGDVKEFTRSVVEGKQTPEVKVDRGGDDAISAYHFAPAGDDSQPLPSDLAYLGEDTGTGNAQALGYQDPDSAPVAGAGEKRIYARSGPGVVACEIWLKADGTVLLKNAQGSLELTVDGTARLSNALGSLELAAAGGATVTTPLGTFGATTHMHTSPFGPTGPPIPGT